MVALESNAVLVSTGSGGMQKEAYLYGVPCVTIRTETGSIELDESGWNRVDSPMEGNIEGGTVSTIGTTGNQVKIYGDGTASQQIAQILAARA